MSGLTAELRLGRVDGRPVPVIVPPKDATEEQRAELDRWRLAVRQYGGYTAVGSLEG